MIKKIWITFLHVVILGVVLILSGCPSPSTPISSEKAIISFIFTAAANAALSSNITATIRGTSISAAAPYATDVTALVPTITVSPGATVNLPSGIAQDFTAQVTYVVTAADGTSQNYAVTIVNAYTLSILQTYTAIYDGWDKYPGKIAIDSSGNIYASQHGDLGKYNLKLTDFRNK